MERTDFPSAKEFEKLDAEVDDLLEMHDKGRVSTADILDRLKKCFQKLRPLVPRKLAVFLTNQQVSLHSEGLRLFEEPEEEIAVWAIAHAYGWRNRNKLTNKANETNIIPQLPDYLSDQENAIRPIFPPKLMWDASAHFQNKVTAALDSPVMHAWFFHNADNQFTNVIISGKGIPPISDQVIDSAFATCVALVPKHDDIILNGIVRLSARQESKEELYTGINKKDGFKRILPSFLQKTIQSPQSSEQIHLVEIPNSAATAFELLKGNLDRLQHDTGFVQVKVISEMELYKLQQLFDDYNSEVTDNEKVYLWNATKHKSDDSFVTTFPYYKFPWIEEGPLKLTLSADLIETPEFDKLISIYQNSIIGNMIADAERRERFYLQQLDNAKAEQKWYQSLSEIKKKKLKPVEVTFEINYELGIPIHITPHKIPASIYYKKNVPYHIEQAHEWYEKMKDFRKSIEQLIGNPSAPLTRLCIARLFDCALRDISPTDVPIVKKLFDNWKRSIQPMLFLEFRCLLSGLEIDPKEVCTHHTFFNLIVDTAANRITLIPNTIFDKERSVAVFDANKKVQLVFDPTDYAQMKNIEEQTEIGMNIFEILSDKEKQNVSMNEIRSTFLDKIRENPYLTFKQIITPWLNVDIKSEEVFENLQQFAIKKNLSCRESVRALNWINEHCYYSAEECLENAEKNGEANAGIFLLRAILECYRNDYNPIETLATLLKSDPYVELALAQSYIQKSHKIDPKLVEDFL